MAAKVFPAFLPPYLSNYRDDSAHEFSKAWLLNTWFQSEKSSSKIMEIK
jgi:hypothetical protein